MSTTETPFCQTCNTQGVRRDERWVECPNPDCAVIAFESVDPMVRPYITAPNGQRVHLGDRIAYRSFGGQIREGVVEEISDDIKNGYPGFAFPGAWGYADQITRVWPA